jgi:hypothetical protein
MLNKLKLIGMVLLLVQFYAITFGQENIEKIPILLEHCAKLEAKLLTLEGKEKEAWFEECKLNYLKVLNLVEGLPENEVDKNKMLYARAYDRIGWFFCTTSNEYKIYQKYRELLDKATKLDPNNFMLYYKKAILVKFRSLTNYKWCILKAYELNPNSPEVNFELGFCFYNTSREPDLVVKHQKLFFENKKHFLPELHHFDTGYPNLKLLKYEPENEAEAEMLKRIEVYKPDDKTRFQLK